MYHRAINMSLVIKRLLEVWSILTHITAMLTNSQNRYKFFFIYIYSYQLLVAPVKAIMDMKKIFSSLHFCQLVNLQQLAQWQFIERHVHLVQHINVQNNNTFTVVIFVAENMLNTFYSFFSKFKNQEHIFGTEMPTVCLSS